MSDHPDRMHNPFDFDAIDPVLFLRRLLLRGLTALGFVRRSP